MITDKTYLLLEELDSIPSGSGSRKAKEEIVKNNVEHLKEYFDIAFNPYRIFHIASIPKKSIVDHPFIHSNLEELASYLEGHKGGTKINKDMVRAFIDVNCKCCPFTKKFMEDAILKKVKVGISTKTLNKFGYGIPEFKCLLAEGNKENNMDGHTFPAFIQPKLDGVRVIRLTDGTCLGRNGKAVPNNNINDHVKVDGDFVLDGEFYSDERNFNEIISIFASEDREIPSDIKLVVFNIVHKDDWVKEQATFTNYREELGLINRIADNGTNIVPIFNETVNSKEEAIDKFNEYLNAGFEGAMLRNIKSNYIWKRAKVKDGILTKLKPHDHADCLIKGFFEGKGKLEGKFGGFLLDFKGKEVRCGGGFSDKQREEYLERMQELEGTWCRVKYNEITPDGSLRFPVFDSLRDEK